MSKVLETLHREHFETATLLDLLERELGYFKAGQRVDYELMSLIVQYLTDYPERCHHPLEDLIIERLEDKPGDKLKLIGDLRAEHKELSKKLHRVHELVEVIYRSIPIEVATFDDALRQFLDSQRDHMRREELALFPLAGTILTDRDWHEIEARATIEADPLYGDPPQDKFRELRETILRWGAENPPPSFAASGS